MAAVLSGWSGIALGTVLTTRDRRTRRNARWRGRRRRPQKGAAMEPRLLAPRAGFKGERPRSAESLPTRASSPLTRARCERRLTWRAVFCGLLRRREAPFCAFCGPSFCTVPNAMPDQREREPVHGNAAARKGHSPFIQLVARGVPGGMDGCPARCLCAHAVDPRVLDVRATGAGARRTCSQKRHGSECMIFPHGISRWARERTKSSAAISIPASGATK